MGGGRRKRLECNEGILKKKYKTKTFCANILLLFEILC